MNRVVGVLTSGGDAPGMNAAIRAVTRSALARGFTVYGIRDGYKGLVNGDFVKLDRSSVSDILSRGGTFWEVLDFQSLKMKRCRILR